MDVASPKNAPAGFQTPPRILIPKLVKSRDGWKLKANARKRKLKTMSVRVRDLEVSRDLWRERALAAEKESSEGKLELAASQAAVVASDVSPDDANPVGDDLKKTSLPLS